MNIWNSKYILTTYKIFNNFSNLIPVQSPQSFAMHAFEQHQANK